MGRSAADSTATYDCVSIHRAQVGGVMVDQSTQRLIPPALPRQPSADAFHGRELFDRDPYGNGIEAPYLEVAFAQSEPERR